MARTACGERLSSSLLALPQQLDAIWKSARSPEAKRELLFEVWDDCAEQGTPEVVRYGQLARATILHFIQKHLPHHTACAYTEMELDRLNAQRASSSVFAPYER